MSACILCGEPIEPDQVAQQTMLLTVDQPTGTALTHVECVLRSVMGGIGHHIDHDYWCEQRHDTDGGLSPRESALAVWRLVHGSGER